MHNKIEEEQTFLLIKLLKEKDIEIHKLKTQLLALRSNLQINPNQSNSKEIILDFNTINTTSRAKSTTNKINPSALFKFDTRNFPYEKLQVLSDRVANNNNKNPNLKKNLYDLFKSKKNINSSFSNNFRKSNKKNSNNSNSNNASLIKECIPTNYNSYNNQGESLNTNCNFFL